MTTHTETAVFGLALPRSQYRPARDFITGTYPTPNRENVAVRIGTELPHGPGYEPSGYVVLTSAEARGLAERLLYLAERQGDDLAISNVLHEAAHAFDLGHCETVEGALAHAFAAMNLAPNGRHARMVRERVERHGSLDGAIEAM